MYSVDRQTQDVVPGTADQARSRHIRARERGSWACSVAPGDSSISRASWASCSYFCLDRLLSMSIILYAFGARERCRC